MALVNINGISQHFDDGTLILNAAKTLGIKIPTFCSHPRLEPVAVCRMCLVEVEGQSRLLPSCATSVTDLQRLRPRQTLPDPHSGMCGPSM